MARTEALNQVVGDLVPPPPAFPDTVSSFSPSMYHDVIAWDRRQQEIHKNACDAAEAYAQTMWENGENPAMIIRRGKPVSIFTDYGVLAARAKYNPDLADQMSQLGWSPASTPLGRIEQLQAIINLGEEYDRLSGGAAPISNLQEAVSDGVRRFVGKAKVQGGKIIEFMASSDESGAIEDIAAPLLDRDNQKKAVVAAVGISLLAHFAPHALVETQHHKSSVAISNVEPNLLSIGIAAKADKHNNGAVTEKEAVDNIQALSSHLKWSAQTKKLPNHENHHVAQLVKIAAHEYASRIAQRDPSSAKVASSVAQLATVIATHPEALDKQTAANLAQPDSPVQAKLATQFKSELVQSTMGQDYLDPYQAEALGNLMAMLALDSAPQGSETGSDYNGKHRNDIAEQAPANSSALQAGLDALKAKGNHEHANWANAATALEFFITKGLTPSQAAGIVGNFWLESVGVNPEQKQYNNGPGRGIAQWEEGARWDVLSTWAATRNLDKFALDTQLQFTWHELQTNRSLAYQKVSEATTPEDAAVAFEKFFEGASIPALETRSHLARMIFNELNDLIAAAETPAQVSAPTDTTQPPTDINVPDLLAGTLHDSSTSQPVQTASELAPNPEVPATINNVVHFSQHDHRWADTAYSTHGDASQTISTSGCEPAAMAMVVSTLTGNLTTPPAMAKFALDRGDRTFNSGTSPEAIPQAAAANNLKYRQIDSADKANVASHILDAIAGNSDSEVNTLVILNGQDSNPATPPTGSGHWYVISRDAGNGQVRVNDPNSVAKSMQPWDLQQLVSASTSIWVVSK